MQTPRSLVALLSSFTLLTACALTACAGEAPECVTQTDCGTATSPCDGCAGEGEGLCLEGTCGDRGEDATSLNITILRIEPRQLEIPSVVWVAADATSPAGPFTCAEALSGQGDGLNVLSSGFKNLSGGAQHTDVAVGRVPEGTVGLLLLGYSEAAGQGEVIASSCEAPVAVSGTDHNYELLTLTGL